MIITFGAIVFSFALTNNVFAYRDYYAYSTDPVGYDYQNYDYNTNYHNPIYPPYTYQQPVVSTTTTTAKPTTSVVNNYYYQTPTTEKVSTTNTTKTSTKNSTNSDNGLSDQAYNSYGQLTGNGITALSLKGSGGFMPSSIWQWIVVVILILIIIIIARMFVHKPTPGDHDSHTAPAH